MKRFAKEAIENVEVWRDNNKDNILDWEGETKPDFWY